MVYHSLNCLVERFLYEPMASGDWATTCHVIHVKSSYFLSNLRLAIDIPEHRPIAQNHLQNPKAYRNFSYQKRIAIAMTEGKDEELIWP